MFSKIRNGVFLIYAVLISFFISFFAGAAVEAHQNALSPLDYLSMKTISQVIEEQTSPAFPAVEGFKAKKETPEGVSFLYSYLII